MKTIRIITIVTFLAFLNSCQKEDLSTTETEENSEAIINGPDSTDKHGPELAFPGQQGKVINLTPGAKRPTIVEKFGDVYVLGGDIILSDEQVEALSKQRGDQNRTAIDPNFVSIWPDGKVYYTIDPTLPDQSRVTDAIASIENSSFIEFIPRTNQPNYINFEPGSGCWTTSVGMAGGKQTIVLAPGCGTGNTMHEIGHALGLFHEQMRADRNSYVIVHDGNIINGYEGNFKTYAQVGHNGFEFGSYDFASIMGYSSYFFSANGNPTITKLDGSTFMTQRSKLSFGDELTLLYLYNSELGLYANNGSSVYRLNSGTDDFGDNDNHLTNYGVQFVGSGSSSIPRDVAHFDGSSYAEGNGFPGLSSTEPRSISAYIKTTANNGTIVSWGSNGSNGSGTSKWAFKIKNGKIGVDVGDGYAYSYYVVNDGNWHHVACTFSGSQVSDIKLYIDGDYVSSWNMQNANVTTRWAPPASGVRIGRDVDNFTDYFTGSMFDVIISEAEWDWSIPAFMQRSYDY